VPMATLKVHADWRNRRVTHRVTDITLGLKLNVFSFMDTPTSTTLPATCVKPAMLAVGATTTIRFEAWIPLAVVTFSMRASEGKNVSFQSKHCFVAYIFVADFSKTSLGLSAQRADWVPTR